MMGKELFIEHPAFSEKWWDSFLLSTDNLSVSVLFKNVLSVQELDFLNDCYRELLKNLHQSNKYRIYVNGKEERSEKIVASFHNYNNSKSWLGDHFSDQKIGIIVNKCEQLSLKLSKRFQALTSPLVDVIGTPVFGFNLTTFSGNYGFTPLGIHQDGKGSNVLHFHLGPSHKVMYNWDEEEFSQEYFDATEIEEAVNRSEKFRVEPGDLYFMPWNKFHIGNTEELSTGITLWFNNPTKASLMNELVKRVISDSPSNSDSIIAPLGADADDDFLFKEMLGYDLWNERISFKTLLSQTNEDIELQIKSNGGWNSASLTDENLKIDGSDIFKAIERESPFFIKYVKRNNKLVIFARGHKLLFDFDQTIVDIIDGINNSKVLLLGDIIKQAPVALQRTVVIIMTSLLQQGAIHLRETS